MLDIVERYCDRTGMIVNVAKTNVMVMEHFRIPAKLTYKGERITEVREFKYLGVIIDDTGGIDVHMEDRRKKMKAMEWRMVGLTLDKYGLSPITGSQVTRAMAIQVG